MISNESKIAHVEKIIATSEAISAGKYKNLLLYLVQCSIADKTPKEYDLATEVFHKGSDYNPAEDSTVRVYMANLRKKLDDYYNSVGKKDKIQIVIPKGHYFVEYHTSSERARENIIRNPNRITIPLILVLVAGLIFTASRISSLNSIIDSGYHALMTHPIWSSTANNDLPISIVLGDDFFYLELTDGEEVITRRHNINTPGQYTDYLAAHENIQSEGKTPYYFLPMSSVKALPRIFQLVDPDEEVSLRPSSSMQSSDLLTHNLIFLGSFRSLFILEQALQDEVWSFTLGLGTGDTLYLNLTVPDTSITYLRTGLPQDEHIDFCLVRNMPGPNKNGMLLFVSFFEAGLMGATNYMTDKDNLDDLASLFVEKFDRVPQYYEILFKVSGHSRTVFKTQVEYINMIDENSIW